MTDFELLDKTTSSLYLAQVKVTERDWSLALDYCSAAHCALQELFNRSRGIRPPATGEATTQEQKPII
jgi:hypothetical protein